MSTGGEVDRDVVRLRLLGRFEVVAAGQRVGEDGWRLRKAKDLIKLLALAPDRRMHREQVVEWLWPTSSPPAAVNNLHQAMHVARRRITLPDGRLVVLTRDLVVLCPDDPPPQIDVVAFEDAARSAAGSGQVAALEQTLAGYGGDLLPEDLYAEWAAPRREQLRRRAHALRVELAGLRLGAGEVARAERELRQVVAEDPVHESAHRMLIQALAGSGRPQEAIRQYQVLTVALRDELGAAPEPASQRLRQELLTGSAGVEHLDRHPSLTLQSAAAAMARRHNLPIRLSTFIGRERQIGQVTEVLRSARLVTLTGPGGAGKTRLALECADAQLTRFDDGVWLADLAPLAGPHAVVQEVREALGAPDPKLDDPTGSLVDYLAQRRLLLVLDNCEHLIEACAELVHRLLAAAPGLRVLATSRQPLRVPGEHVHQVPPLTLPPAGVPLSLTDLSGYEAPQLFIERARAVAPDRPVREPEAAALTQVCHRLDGMPLAIELAAARTPVLSVTGIAARLADRFRLLSSGETSALTRQQTLKATVDWSHDLLTAPERALFRRLAVFAGGFELAAAERVCAATDTPATDLLDLLHALAAKSLVTVLATETSTRAAPRFRLLETMRAYARDRLREAGETDALRRRHATWALELSAHAAVGLRGRQRLDWLDRLEDEHDNLRAALRWLIDQQPRDALGMAGQLWPFWLWRGYLSEGSRWLRETLQHAPEPTIERADALLGACPLGVRGGAVTKIDLTASAGESVRLAQVHNDLQRARACPADHECGMR